MTDLHAAVGRRLEGDETQGQELLAGGRLQIRVAASVAKRRPNAQMTKSVRDTTTGGRESKNYHKAKLCGW